MIFISFLFCRRARFNFARARNCFVCSNMKNFKVKVFGNTPRLNCFYYLPFIVNAMVVYFAHQVLIGSMNFVELLTQLVSPIVQSPIVISKFQKRERGRERISTKAHIYHISMRPTALQISNVSIPKLTCFAFSYSPCAVLSPLSCS